MSTPPRHIRARRHYVPKIGRGFKSTEYGKGLSTDIRRHSVESHYTLPSKKAMIIPLVSMIQTEPANTNLTTYDGEVEKVYTDFTAQKGSRIGKYKLDLLITPKVASDSVVIDVYTGMIILSFHDIKSGEIRGLGYKADGTNGSEGYHVQFRDDSGTQTEISTKVSPTLTFDKLQFDYSDGLKHWWRGVTKQTLAAGVPVSYSRYMTVPRKVRRMNNGTFWGLVVMNDAGAFVPTKDDPGPELSIEAKIKFSEIPTV